MALCSVTAPNGNGISRNANGTRNDMLEWCELDEIVIQLDIIVWRSNSFVKEEKNRNGEIVEIQKKKHDFTILVKFNGDKFGAIVTCVPRAVELSQKLQRAQIITKCKMNCLQISIATFQF